MNERLDAALREWSRETAELGPPPQVERAVLAEFDRSRRRVHWTVVGTAVAAVLAVAVWVGMPQPPVVAPEATPEAEFVALPYVVQPAQFERTEIVRVSMPVAELIAVGFPMRADPGALVQADVVVGQDGRARAVRLVENFE